MPPLKPPFNQSLGRSQDGLTPSGGLMQSGKIGGSLTPPQLQLAARHLTLLQALLAQHVPEAEVWAFGSRVTGGAHEGSDLDLVLRNPPNLSLPITGWALLREALQNSMLPMLVEIHDWAHLPAAFHSQIEREYVVVQRPIQSVD
jgi:uncharacterized protein